jgi:hypothetical protein
MHNGNGGAGREIRLQLMLAPEELKAVDTFRFRHQMPSRAAAARELFRLGLAAGEALISNPGAPSNTYGVLPPETGDTSN